MLRLSSVFSVLKAKRTSIQNTVTVTTESGYSQIVTGFYLDFTQNFSGFYSDSIWDFIQVQLWFYSDPTSRFHSHSIWFLLWFYPDSTRILFRLYPILLGSCLDFIQTLLSFYPDSIWIFLSWFCTELHRNGSICGRVSVMRSQFKALDSQHLRLRGWGVLFLQTRDTTGSLIPVTPAFYMEGKKAFDWRNLSLLSFWSGLITGNAVFGYLSYLTAIDCETGVFRAKHRAFSAFVNTR